MKNIVLISSCILSLAACSAPQSYPFPSDYANQTANTTGSNVEEGIKPPNMGFKHVPEDDGKLLQLWSVTAQDLLTKLSSQVAFPPRGSSVAIAQPSNIKTTDRAAIAMHNQFDYAIRSFLANNGYRIVPANDEGAALVLYPYVKLYEPPKDAAQEEPSPKGMNKFVLSITTAPMPEKVKKDTVLPAGVSATYTLPAYDL